MIQSYPSDEHKIGFATDTDVLCSVEYRVRAFIAVKSIKHFSNAHIVEQEAHHQVGLGKTRAA